MLTLLLGGARSGKSAMAVAIAASTGLAVTFIATAEARDSEFAERIARHRAERPAHWTTIEEPLELGAALSAVPAGNATVIDCLTLWVANLFETGLVADQIVERASEVAALAKTSPDPVVVVSNEVGSGIVPADVLSRSYRDALGGANTAFSVAAGEAYLVVAGRTLMLGPVVK